MQSAIILLVQCLLFIPSRLLWLVGLVFPKDEKLWVFGAWLGARYGDNPKYLYEYISNNEKEQCRAVWLTRDKEVYKLLTRKGMTVHLFYSPLGIWYAMRAKYLVLCVAYQDLSYFSYLLARKAVIINLWHGTPLKRLTINRSLTQTIAREALIFHLDRECDYVCSASNLVTEKLKLYFDIPKDNFLVTGYPRNDGIFRQNHLTEKKIVPDLVASEKIILYMPTFREPTGHSKRTNLFDDYGFDAMRLERMLEKNRAVLLVKLHFRDAPLLASVIKMASKRIIIVNDDQIEGDIYTLLGEADILITDYSSVYFDFLLLNRPIIFASFDLAQYQELDRGFYFDYESVTPGPRAYTWLEVESKIKSILDGQDPYENDRLGTSESMNTYKDEFSSKRVFRALCGVKNE